ncbi:hypothetical protein [Listeria seeligeri]|uniref:hypothetical protein n=1 Tax=Listeria seeligeri TaxID=1640 RepID=UPI0016243A9C|nr:hypothetical protein [Listeria seeligeri]MBC1722237.1 hypothetical protein [Listeria seeligeri]MBF2435764.1 hypothetical protein [Listeria seeligeri]
MEIYITTNSEGYVDGYSYCEISPGHKIQISEEDQFFQRGFASYKYIAGELVYEEAKDKMMQQQKQIKEAAPSVNEQLIATQEALAGVYEQNANLQQQLIDTQIAMVEMFEAAL